jgi:hypothetical protein
VKNFPFLELGVLKRDINDFSRLHGKTFRSRVWQKLIGTRSLFSLRAGEEPSPVVCMVFGHPNDQGNS